ncbi:MAG: TonB-dependent receptor [Tannerella sp.]|jgi:TonB-linked SusC/RagA family outer membrane protein|nr:TonB-dependent receptor [Tannerella sp.]
MNLKKLINTKSIILIFMLTCAVWAAFGQERTARSNDVGRKIQVTGVVTDETGETVPGAAVVVKGSTRGVTTDVDGTFAIDVAPTDVLDFSYLGYEMQTIPVNARTVINVRLVPKKNELDEVTVVAFAKQKKESVISSISTVNVKDLKIPSSNLTTAFAGRVAGLISYQTSGEPGQDNANFFIRGITTFGAEAKKDPLILIDGVELTTDDLARLNTDDIASFSIMKDATATALYGARGANGVIYVTTKEGREGKAQINFRLESSFSGATQMIDIADPVMFMRLHNEAIITRDPQGGYAYSPEQIRMTEEGRYPNIYPATDWYGEMFDKYTFNRRANMSISGGGTVARYYVAVNVTQDNGNLKVDKLNNFNTNVNLTKYAVRSNVNVNVSKTTEMILRLSSTFDEYTGPIDGGSEVYRKVMQANPVLFKPFYEPDDENKALKRVMFGNYGQGNYLNPYADMMRGYKDYSTNMTLTQFEIKQKLDMLTEGLTFRTMVNMNRYSSFSVTRAYQPFYYNIDSYDLLTDTYTLWCLNPDGGQDYIDYIPGNRVINTVFYLESALEYNKAINEKHNLNGLLVYIMRQAKEGLANNLQLSLPNRNIGLSGRLAYNYDTRYFAEFNFGYNGSERFSKKHRWGFFPSLGLAWLLSNEAFFEPFKTSVPTLKLKATYGIAGNDAIGSNNDRFYYLAEVNMAANKPSYWGGASMAGWSSISGIDVSRYANDAISWEVADKMNLGLEFILKNGLSANIDLFREKRTNILTDRVVPATLGVLPAIKANLGVAEGKGIDIELNSENNINKNFWLVGRGTFTYATSKVLKWEEPDYSLTPWLSRVGHKINQTYGYIAERLFIDEAEVAKSPRQFGEVMGGDIKYHDVNGDGKISELDKVAIGYPTVPEINYGFGFTAGFKGIDASFFFQGSARQSFWLDTYRLMPFGDPDAGDGKIGQTVVISAIADDYWTEHNRNPYAFWPRLSTSIVSNNAQTSSWFMHDASFLRLKTIEVGYSLPTAVANKLYMSNLRLYFSGTNLASFSAFKLWDPELGGNGLGYPLQRVFNFGLNLGF